MPAIIIRNVPEQIRRELKSWAATEGKPMQMIILDLIVKYIQEKRIEGRE